MRVSESMRTIRGIERSAAYTRIQPASRYGAYPYREGEPQLPPQSPDDDWSRELRRAAGSASEWQQLTKQALAVVDRILSSAQRERGQIPAKPALSKDQLEQLAAHIKVLRTSYSGNAEYLRPEAWLPIEQVIRHADESDRQRLDDISLLRKLRSALACSSEQRASQLIRLTPHPAMPYAAYYSSMQSYWPLPAIGTLMNRYY
ncbi:hypothetical protein [Paenibacillus harenae]|uniref:hypothetical protein n=1 Tax=Paenibacillus harenae TaxID=306543 RepID=UPI0027927283|nr:hypothetical protein [Paenibacillus harenae]MDQ0060890.1 hypothetical protein [Paenibacillus harenae]